ncbi:hypothetical protein [Trichocoleus sp. DQ-U1]|uniref:hypothetical protein n=1 Tax=Trichocoleus sp. DQ-U1 TaxID=2933926 RepID=UPI003299C3BC
MSDHTQQATGDRFYFSHIPKGHNLTPSKLTSVWDHKSQEHLLCTEAEPIALFTPDNVHYRLSHQA